MWSRAFSAIIVAALALSIAACSTSGCLENRNSVPLAGFYGSDGEGVRLDSLEVTGLGVPSNEPLSAAGQSISSIYLPMRSTQQSTAWVFSYKWESTNTPLLNDTIEFEYDTTPYFASSDCGVINKYKILRLKHTCHIVDSIILVDSLITNVDIEQIKIYFRTAVADQPEESESE